MPETTPGEISRVKIEAQPIPEYRIVYLPGTQIFSTYIAGESIIKAEIIGVSYQSALGKFLACLGLGVGGQALNNRVVDTQIQRELVCGPNILSGVLRMPDNESPENAYSLLLQ